MKEFAHKKKIAFKALGGKVKGFCWHIGVARALEERGFRFLGGPRKEGTPREYGGLRINPLIGSSAGALFVTLIASGLSVRDLQKVEIPRKLIFRSSGTSPVDYLRRVARRASWRTGRPFQLGDLEFGDLLAFRGMYTMAGLEQYLREAHLAGRNRFEDLAAELYIITTELDRPRAVVFGEKDEDRRTDYVYRPGVPVSQAAAASMSVPPFFAPFPIERRGTSQFFIDGDLRDPYSTHAAEEAGADLVFVSSVYEPYRATHRRASLFEFGASSIYGQIIDHALDSMKQNAIRRRRQARDLYAAITFFTEGRLGREEQQSLLSLVEQYLDYRRQNTIIYLSPGGDEELYRINPFDFTPKVQQFIIERAFRRTLRILGEYRGGGTDLVHRATDPRSDAYRRGAIPGPSSTSGP